MSDYLPYPSNGPVYKGGRWIQPREQQENYQRKMENRAIASRLAYWEKVEAGRPKKPGPDCTNTELFLWIIGFIIVIISLYYFKLWFDSGLEEMYRKVCSHNRRQHHC